MWKFGLLGGTSATASSTTIPTDTIAGFRAEGEKNHPHFGDLLNYNVIDTRQSEAQNTVIEALRGLGHTEAASTTLISLTRWSR